MRTGSASNKRKRSEFFETVVKNFPIAYIMKEYGLDEKRATCIHAYIRDGMNDRKSALLEAGYAQSTADSSFQFDKRKEEKLVITDFFNEINNIDESERIQTYMKARRELKKELDEPWRDGIHMTAIRIGLSIGEKTGNSNNGQLDIFENLDEENVDINTKEQIELLQMAGVLA